MLLNITPGEQTAPGQYNENVLKREIGVENVAKAFASEVAFFTVPAVDHGSKRLYRVS